MNFSTRLIVSGIFLSLFTFAFADYLSLHPWPTTLEMYPCLIVTGLVGLFLCTTPRNSH